MPPDDNSPFLVSNHLEELILHEGRIGHLWLVSHAERRAGEVYIADGGLEIYEPTHWRPLNPDWFSAALGESGFVCVPIKPTDAMLKAAWAEALAENALGVWETMIGVWMGRLTTEGIPVEEAKPLLD